ncbi:trigger factor-related chaperone [Mycoplasma leonicaptivi]|uniref:trigger factor-related chaperone n=1 Tax=Mycoplasma leonicaptivi TaxID=36742 RepID=UPI0004811C0C|nr:hypothetical protein [Mycoplasma leonicaptivi]
MHKTQEIIKISKDEWLKIQNLALKTLEQNKQNINQETILKTASDIFIEEKKAELFRKNQKELVNFKFYFLPKFKITKMSVEEIDVEAESFFFEKKDIENIDFMKYIKDIKFQIIDNYQTTVDTFLMTYIKNYPFKKPRKNGELIQENDIVTFEITADNKPKLTKTLVANSNASKDAFENFVINQKVGETFTKSLETPEGKINVNINPINVQSQHFADITDENCKELGIEEIKNLKDVKEYIKKTIMIQIISDSLVSFGSKIIDNLSKDERDLSFSQEFIDAELSNFNFDNNFVGDKIETAIQGLKSYLWTNYLTVLNDIKVTKEDLQQEYEIVSRAVGANNDERFADPRFLGQAVFYKKIAKIYGKLIQPEFLEKFKDYI